MVYSCQCTYVTDLLLPCMPACPHPRGGGPPGQYRAAPGRPSVSGVAHPARAGGFRGPHGGRWDVLKCRRMYAVTKLPGFNIYVKSFAQYF